MRTAALMVPERNTKKKAPKATVEKRRSTTAAIGT